jgi:hypothetical protein
MRRSLATLTVCAALAAAAGPVNAGPCGDAIARLQEAARRAATDPAIGPTAPQSIGAQLGRQPTPDSVRRAQDEAQSRFAAIVARAQALDAEGKLAECLQAVADAKRMLDLD